MPAPVSLRVVCLVSLLLASATLGAQTTYRWIDPATGRTVLSDLPPPAGAKRVDRSSPSLGDEAPPTQALPYAVRQASEKFPVVLYTNPGCTTCKQARSLLDGRGVPFVEKELGTAEELADAGRQLGGEIRLPSISVGRQNVKGFTPTTWNELLDAAGYPASAPYRAKPTGEAAQ